MFLSIDETPTPKKKKTFQFAQNTKPYLMSINISITRPLSIDPAALTLCTDYRDLSHFKVAPLRECLDNI